MYLGAKHMVTGYDHLLFLVGVIFFLYRLKDILLYVSLFTIGHSLTLLGGALGGIRANAYLIDAVIGLSIVYKAFENMGGFKAIGIPAEHARRGAGVRARARVRPGDEAAGVFALTQRARHQHRQLQRRRRSRAVPGPDRGAARARLLAHTRRATCVTPMSTNAALMTAGFLLAGYQLTGLLHGDTMTIHLCHRRPLAPPSLATLAKTTAVSVLVAAPPPGHDCAARRIRHRSDGHRPGARPDGHRLAAGRSRSRTPPNGAASGAASRTGRSASTPPSSPSTCSKSRWTVRVRGIQVPAREGRDDAVFMDGERAGDPRLARRAGGGDDGVPPEQSFDKQDRREASGSLRRRLPAFTGGTGRIPAGRPSPFGLTSAGYYTSAVEIRSDRSRRTRELRSLDALPLFAPPAGPGGQP